MTLIVVQTWHMPYPKPGVQEMGHPMTMAHLNVNIRPMMQAFQRVGKAIGRFAPQPAPMTGACPTCALPRPIGDMFGVAPTCEGCQW